MDKCETLKSEVSQINLLEKKLTEHQQWLNKVLQELKQPENDVLLKKCQKHLQIIESDFLTRSLSL